MKKTTINSGDKFGMLTVVCETPPRVNTQGRHIRVISCRCDCGNIKDVLLSDLSRGHTLSCGCYQKAQASMYNKRHGEYNTRIYRLWRDIKNRCNNESVINYPRYGGRGIKVCEQWDNSYYSFRDYIKTLKGWDNKEMTFDRINNNGDYEPGNVRFTSTTIQSRNRRVNKQNKTNHRGITLEIMPSGNYRYRASIGVGGGKRHQIGSFKTIIDAVNARNKYIIVNNLVGYELENYDNITEKTFEELVNER